MLQRVKKIVRHTAIYGLGNISTKLIGIILLPLYTRHISVAEYGVLGILEITILLLTQVVILGQAQAVIRYHSSPEYRERGKTTLFTISVFLLAVGAVFVATGLSIAKPIAAYFDKPQLFAHYFKLCIIIIWLRVITTLFLAALRSKERSVFYAVSNIIKFTLIMISNVVFIAVLGMGVKGILLAYIVGDAALLIMLLPSMLKEMTAKFDPALLKAALKFGFPLVFSAISFMLLNSGSRYILKFLTNYHEVGLFNLGYKVAGVLNMFFIQAFQLSLRPMAYKIYGQPNDRRFYSKMLTYFIFAISWAGLALAMFGKELISTLALNPKYWAAYQVVPLIILAYIFNGGKIVVSLGLLLKNKTRYIAYTTFGALVINIALNFLLIPKLRMVGAATASVISFFLLFIATYYYSNKYYIIHYELSKLTKLILVTITLFFISTLIVNATLAVSVALKCTLLLSLPFILYVLKFYEPIEIDRLKTAALKLYKIIRKR